MKDPNSIKAAILLVNGNYNYRNKLWLEVSVANIVRYISPHRSYRIFVWNNDDENQAVASYLHSYRHVLEVLDKNTFDLGKYDPERKFRLSPGEGGTLAGGFHPHSTPLQILYEYAIAKYSIDIVFTFDNDSCPVRANWDIPVVHALDRGIKITGIWRDELRQVITPYVHPAFLGIKVETIRDSGLTFNQLPIFGKVDTLAHFTYAIQDKFGEEAVFPLKRNNRLQFHNVFNGIYGSLFYHHHLGTRNRAGTSNFLRSYGWKERNEQMIENRLIMDGTTEMVFTDHEDFFNSLTYGADYQKYKLYLKYLQANPSKYRSYKLYHLARSVYHRSRPECFFILTIILKELIEEEKFVKFYIQLCRELGFEEEANAYQGILEGSYSVS
jgi:hypothetical protein